MTTLSVAESIPQARHMPICYRWVAAFVHEAGRLLLGRLPLKNYPPALIYARSLGVLTGTRSHREHRGTLLSSALQNGCMDFHNSSPPKSPTARFRVVHATTPIDQTHMPHFWRADRDFATAPKAKDRLVRAIREGFEEGRVFLETTQAQANRRPPMSQYLLTRRQGRGEPVKRRQQDLRHRALERIHFTVCAAMARRSNRQRFAG